MPLPDANRNIFDARELGLSTSNSAAANRAALQSAIDDLSADTGGIITFAESYPCDGTIQLKKNIQLIGSASGFKGVMPANGASQGLSATPGSGGFIITDTTNAFIRINDFNTAIKNLSFHYPSQPITSTDPAADLIEYPATITRNTSQVMGGCELRNLTFTGAWTCMDFQGSLSNYSADWIIDGCYGYPLSGRFLRMQYVLDIPRITRCHVNPGQGYPVYGIIANGITASNDVIEYVIDNGEAAFEIQNTDEFVFTQCFVFGGKTGYRINDSYGTMSQCTADEVEVGVYVTIPSGSEHKYVAIDGFNGIPAAGAPANRNQFVFDGPGGLLKLSNCHSYTGSNVVVDSSFVSGTNSFLKVSGSGSQYVQIVNCSTKKHPTVGWNFTKSIDLVNTSAIVKDVGSTWNDCTTVTATNLDLNTSNTSLVVKGVELGTGNAVAALSGEVANRLITIVRDGVEYKLLAYLDTGSGVTADDVATAMPNAPSGERSAIATAINSAASGQVFNATTVLTTLSNIGYWYPLTKDSAAFSDAGGTTPCTNGTGIYTLKSWLTNTSLTQATSGQRPTFNTAGSTFVTASSTEIKNTGSIITGNSGTLIFAGKPSSNSVNGLFLKIGGSSDGLGMGVGNTTADNNGNNLIGLYEGVFWHPSSQAIGTAFSISVFTFNGTTGTLYFNGDEVNQATGGYYSASGPITIGSGNAGRYMDGTCISAMFDSSALTASEVLQISRFLNAYHSLGVF